MDYNFDFHEIEFCKGFLKEKYPIDLGDYYVLAVSADKKRIWINEVKVLYKVGSLYEDQIEKKSFL